MNLTGSGHVCELLAAEQQHVEQAVQDWKAWWAGMKQMGYPNFGELELHLSRIFDRLRSHFEHEEQSGHLEHLSKASSTDPNTYLELVQEHSEILSRLKGLADRLQMYTSSEFSWINACREFDEILEVLRCHEQKETDLEKAAHFVTESLCPSASPEEVSPHSPLTSSG